MRILFSVRGSFVKLNLKVGEGIRPGHIYCSRDLRDLLRTADLRPTKP